MPMRDGSTHEQKIERVDQPMVPMTPTEQAPDDHKCICPHDARPLGRLYGISMGKGTVRLSTATGCPIHDPNTHEFTPAERKPWSVGDPLCVKCHTPEKRHP